MSETFSTRRRAARILLFAVGALIVIGAAGVWWLTQLTAPQMLQRGLTVAVRDPEAGERWMRRALAAAGGKYPDAELALARLSARQGEWSEATALLAGIDKHACRGDLLLAFGRDALDSGHRDLALMVLQPLVERDGPDALEAVDLLIPVYQEWGQQDELVNVAMRGTQVAPDDPQRWIVLIEMLTAMRRDAECLTTIRRAQEQHLSEEMQQELQHRLVQQLFGQGDAAEVRQALDQLRKSEGESVRVQAHEVVLLRMEGQLEEALKRLNELAPKLRDRFFLYSTRGGLQLDLGRYKPAIDDLGRAIALQPFNSQAQFKLSEAYRNAGLPDLARKHRDIASLVQEKRKRINELLKLRLEQPRSSQLYAELARLHADLGEANAARQWSNWLADHGLDLKK